MIASRTPREGRFSPDGNYIAYTLAESGRDEVYVQAMPPSKQRQKVSINGGYQPRWRRDGRELFFVSPLDRAMMAADVAAGDTIEVGAPRELFRLPGPVSFKVRCPRRRPAISHSWIRENGPMTFRSRWS